MDTCFIAASLSTPLRFGQAKSLNVYNEAKVPGITLCVKLPDDVSAGRPSEGLAKQPSVQPLAGDTIVPSHPVEMKERPRFRLGAQVSIHESEGSRLEVNRINSISETSILSPTSFASTQCRSHKATEFRFGGRGLWKHVGLARPLYSVYRISARLHLWASERLRVFVYGL